MAAKRITDLPDSEPITGAEFIEVSQVSTTIKVAGGTISAAAADNSYSDSAAGFLTAGFAVGDRVNVIGFAAGGNNLALGTVTALTASKMTIGGTEGDTIVDAVTGPTVTIAKWISRKALTSDIGGGGGGSGVPDGGTTGQVLTKLSDTDGDADWQDPTGGGGGGGAGNWVASATWHWTGSAVVIDTATNVDSITRSYPGLYEIVFTTEAPAADYEVFGAGEFAAGATTDGIRGGSFNLGGGRSTTSCKVFIEKESVGSGGGYDAPRMSIMMFSMGALPFSGGGAGDAKVQNQIDIPPVSPSLWNEEFDLPDGDPMPASFTWYNRTGSGQNYNAEVRNRKLLLRQTVATSGWKFAAICKPPPSGDFDIVTKLTLSGLARDYASIAPAIFDSVSGKFTTASFHARANGRFYISWNRWNNFNSLNTDNSFEVGVATIYVRIKRVGTVISAMFSPDGEMWTKYTTPETEGVFIPSGWDQFGFFLKSENTSYPVKAVIHWLRDYQGASLPDDTYLG